MRGILLRGDRKKCPSCGKQDSYVIESRKSGKVIRRRLECISCKHRHSTVEMSIEHYHELKDSKVKLDRIMSLLGFSSEEVLSKTTEDYVDDQTTLCDTCEAFYQNKCLYNLPEVGTFESKDCNLFETKK